MTDKSNIKLKSNINASSVFLDSVVPLEVLRERCTVSNPLDVRVIGYLPKRQRDEYEKLRYLATRIIDVEMDSDDQG